MSDKRVEVIRPDAQQQLHGVEHRPNYRRDPYSKAIFLVDEKAIFEHQQKKVERSKLNSANDRISSLENNVKEMKSMLSSLINMLEEGNKN
jgi:hypothetical protein